MSAPFLDQIDWSRPWLTPLQEIAAPIVQAADWRAALNQAACAANLHNHRGLPLRFVAQADLPDMPYEAFISATGGVPTRDNLHDFFNALVWLAFPQIKMQLNAMQSAAIAQAASVALPDSEKLNDKLHGKLRGKLRDAATIFDENAALLIVRNPALIDALRNHQWHWLFVARRVSFERDCDVLLFGHALLEKLVNPYKAITAHAWIVPAGDEWFALESRARRSKIDVAVAAQLQQSAQRLATSDFTPLPVLGVPGWYNGQDDNFYADATVFRPKRNVS